MVLVPALTLLKNIRQFEVTINIILGIDFPKRIFNIA